MVNSNQYFIRGTGKPLVFQHGLGASQSQIKSLLTDLGNIKLLTMDTPGHGVFPYDESNTPSFQSYTDEVIRVMDITGIYKTVAGGLSMGSGIAVNMAMRYPKRVAGLILLRPAWHYSAYPENLRILLKVADYLDNTTGQTGFESLPEFALIREKIPKAAASILGMFNREQQVYTSPLLRAMVGDQPCLTETPPGIDLPALIIGNDDDPLHPWEMAEKWHQTLPNSGLIKVPSRYTDPDGHRIKVINAIQEFMNDITINKM